MKTQQSKDWTRESPRLWHYKKLCDAGWKARVGRKGREGMVVVHGGGGQGRFGKVTRPGCLAGWSRLDDASRHGSPSFLISTRLQP
jgi:hypothetical protein